MGQSERMLWILALGQASVASPSFPDQPQRAAMMATATVRIERAQPVTAEEWSRLPTIVRRELRRVDESGKPIIIRVIEHP